MDAFIYCRKSQEDKNRQIQSLDDQSTACQRIAREEGLRVVAEIREAFSAKRPGRPQFDAMVDRIRAGEAQCIIAWHPDRLSRNAVDAGVIIDLLDVGLLVDLKFPTYKFENTASGKWMLSTVLGLAKYENDKKAVDVTRGVRSKVAKGIPPRRAIPGYLNDMVMRTFEPDPERFQLVQAAVRLVLGGTHSPHAALRELNQAWGFHTKRRMGGGGRPLSASVWYALLRNPVICGRFSHGGTIHEGTFKPMISPLEFDRLQQVFETVSPRPKVLSFAFGGLIQCAACGCRVVGERKFKTIGGGRIVREYRYYHCSGRRGCPRTSLTEEQVGSTFDTFLARLRVAREFADWAQPQAAAFFAECEGGDQTAVRRLRQRLTQAERRRQNLIELRLEDPGALSPAEFQSHKARIDAEVEEVKRSIRLAESAFMRTEDRVRKVLSAIAGAPERCLGDDPRAFKRLIGEVASRCVLTRENIEITPHPCVLPVLTFEPPKTPSGNRSAGYHRALFSGWQRLLEDIRTAAQQSFAVADQDDSPNSLAA